MKIALISTILFTLFDNQSVYSNPIKLVEQHLAVGIKTVSLQVPEGMRVEFVAPLASPRFISLGPEKEFIIGSKSGNIYRLPFPYSTVETLIKVSGYVHSVAYLNNRLYFAETSAVWSAPYSGVVTNLTSEDLTLLTPLPSATGGHNSRTIVTGPDNKLYVGIGISGNCSDEYLDKSYPFERRRGGVFQMDTEGNLLPYSSGLRNPIGLTFNPTTGKLLATNAGPDNLGYDQPPEVLVELQQGSFHGMPWFQFYNNTFRSGECSSNTSPRPIQEASQPRALFLPRSTPQSIAFLPDTTLGKEFMGNAVVAIHGSWAKKPGAGNESRRMPKIVMVNFTHTPFADVTELITGFQRTDGSRFARPSGIAIGHDGYLYFTSDNGEVRGLFRLVPSP